MAFSSDFTQPEIAALESDLQQEVYALASMYAQLEILRHMRPLGFVRGEESVMPKSASIFGCNMDALEANETLQAYLKDKRANSLLLTNDEFAKLTQEAYFLTGGAWVVFWVAIIWKKQ